MNDLFSASAKNPHPQSASFVFCFFSFCLNYKIIPTLGNLCFFSISPDRFHIRWVNGEMPKVFLCVDLLKVTVQYLQLEQERH